ncbi:MAG TPA: hypothetical protein VHG91_07225 [Longimicrobium sp.]|nr:hypothetical protein [Longimicrobium sp.]
MAEVLAWLLGFVTQDVDRKSAARDWRLALLAALLLAGAGAALWRFPDPSEMASRRVPAVVCLALGALLLAYGVFVYFRQRPATLPPDRIAVGIARLRPVGGGKAGALGEEAAYELYRALHRAQKAGAPIQVRRVFASVPDADTEEERAESARQLAQQPNVRVHLLVWGDAVAGRRGRVYLNLAAAHPAPPAELRDAPSQEYEALVQEYPDLSYADFVLLHCGEALAAAEAHERALAVTERVRSAACAALRGHAHLRLAEYQPAEVCRDHLQRAVAEFERLTGPAPDPATFRSYATHRGRSEWTAHFGRLDSLRILARERDGAEQTATLIDLVGAYRAALAQAKTAGAGACGQALDWWSQYAYLLSSVHSQGDREPLSNLQESLAILERIIGEDARRADTEERMLKNVVSLLSATCYGMSVGLEHSALDAAQECVRKAAAGLPSLAHVLHDLIAAHIPATDLDRWASEGNRDQIRLGISAAERLLAGKHLRKNSVVRKEISFALGCNYKLLAYSYPPGPDCRAALLRSVSALQAWSQMPSIYSPGLDANTLNLAGVYLDIASDPTAMPEDAVQFALLGRTVLEALLADGRLQPGHRSRSVAHKHLAIALCILARYQITGRESLLADARAHARIAADRGFDTTWVDTQVESLGAEIAATRPVNTAAAH